MTKRKTGAQPALEGRQTPTEAEHDLSSTIGRMEDTILDLSQRVAFLECLLDMSIRTTDTALRGHVAMLIRMFEAAMETMDPATRYEAREFIIRMRALGKGD